MMFGKNKYNILILGNDGMLGHELYEALIKLSSIKYSNIGVVIGIDVKDGIDLTKRHALSNFLASTIQFDYCINCVAYTNTKAAETTKDGKELDYKLNALAPKYIAESCKYWNIKLIHISTDYVFSEKSNHIQNNNFLPFDINDETFPCNVYGYDKLLGEKFIEEIYGIHSKKYAILRVSWLYGMHNNKSFIHKFLKNVAIKIKSNSLTELTMTTNEISVPTSVDYVISCIRDVIDHKKYGIFHAVPTFDKNGVSRFNFAQAILEFFESNPEKIQYTINSINLKNIKLIPKEYDGYQPKFSAMKNNKNFEKYEVLIGPNIYWKNDLKNFMLKNKDTLFEFMQKFI